MHLLIVITLNKLGGKHVWEGYDYLREDLLCTCKCSSTSFINPQGFPMPWGVFVNGEVLNRPSSENG